MFEREIEKYLSLFDGEPHQAEGHLAHFRSAYLNLTELHYTSPNIIYILTAASASGNVTSLPAMSVIYFAKRKNKCDARHIYCLIFVLFAGF
jgi:hypothetical protein